MYQALYRKYRPQTFDDVVGQNVVTTTLKNQVVTGRLSHAYLFTGTHGTGKTTCAKILAKAINCEHPENGNPCNCCPTCRGIDSGSILDVQEMDAASNSRVDNIRAILDEVVYLPAAAKKRVYIIDEVHMLSTSAFNALLKTIEEPPEYLVFILATTELNKIPATILSRCQRFAFRRPDASEITGRINYVAHQEGIEIDSEAAELLGRLADGAFRDGLSLLDQCASAAVGELNVDSVYRTLGLAGERQTADLMHRIAERDSAGVLAEYSRLYSEGKESAAMLNELSTLARDMLVLKTAPQSAVNMISSTCTLKEIQALEPLFTEQELLRILELLQDTSSRFRSSVNQRLDCELCLMRLCAPEAGEKPADLAARLSRLEADFRFRLRELENKLSTGMFVISSGSAAADQTELPKELPVELPEIPDAAPEDSGSEPDADWEALLGKVLGEIPPKDRIFLQTQFSGRFSGRTLILRAGSAFAASVLKPDQDLIAGVIERAALTEMNRAVRVKFVSADGSAEAADTDLLMTLAEDIEKNNLDHE